jgi:hypothetical protein
MTNWDDDPESRLALMLRAFSMDILDDDLRETHRLYVDIDRVIGGRSLEQIFLVLTVTMQTVSINNASSLEEAHRMLEELCEYARQGLDGMWDAARKPMPKPTHQGGSG